MGNRITQSQAYVNSGCDQKRIVLKTRKPAKPASALSSLTLGNSKNEKQLCVGDSDDGSTHVLAYDKICQITTNQKEKLSRDFKPAPMKRCDTVKMDRKVKWIHWFRRKHGRCRDIDNQGFVLNESTRMSNPHSTSERTSSVLKSNHLCHRPSVASTSSGDYSIGHYTHEPQTTINSTNHRRPQLASTGVCSKSDPMLPQNYPRDVHSSSHGDCTDKCASPTGSWLGFKAQGDIKRCNSAFDQEDDLLQGSRAARSLNSRLGVFTYPDGRVQYTAFLRAGAYGMHTKDWLRDVRKRVSRSLAGLQRQYKCKIDIGDEPLAYRGSTVHSLVIRGQNQTEIIRCKNALPMCLEKQLITSHAVYGASLRICQ